MKIISRKIFERADPLAKSQHPDQVLIGLLSFITNIGSRRFLTGAGYNKEIESWVAVLFTYALRKWLKREWFIQQISDPPIFL